MPWPIDPKTPQAEPTPDLLEIDGDFYLSMTIQHDRRATFLNAEVTSDLSSWAGSPTDIEIYINEAIGGEIERLTIRDLTPIDFAHPRRFMRLSAPK